MRNYRPQFYIGVELDPRNWTLMWISNTYPRRHYSYILVVGPIFVSFKSYGKELIDECI